MASVHGIYYLTTHFLGEREARSRAHAQTLILYHQRAMRAIPLLIPPFYGSWRIRDPSYFRQRNKRV